MFKYTDEEFILATKSSLSIRQVLIKLNILPVTTNYRSFRRIAERLNVDYSHFKGKSTGGNSSGNLGTFNKRASLEEILVKNSSFARTSEIKQRLFKAGLLINHCYICNIEKWQNKEITLHLDHINGTHNDNRIENLRILCPNCHSQTNTYCGKNVKKENRNSSSKKLCPVCQENMILKYSMTCVNCYKQIKDDTINWPKFSELLKIFKNSSYRRMAPQLNTSESSIQRYFKKTLRKIFNLSNEENLTPEIIKEYIPQYLSMVELGTIQE